jgi:hypothetical protein
MRKLFAAFAGTVRRIVRIRRCDNCGTFNPRILDGNPRLCGEAKCTSPDGFYRRLGAELGTNGKVGLWRIQFPIYIRWRGWWTL